jgi:hypothetical protein
LWREPNYDLWEEYGDRRQSYTQATIYILCSKCGRAGPAGAAHYSSLRAARPSAGQVGTL